MDLSSQLGCAAKLCKRTAFKKVSHDGQFKSTSKELQALLFVAQEKICGNYEAFSILNKQISPKAIANVTCSNMSTVWLPCTCGRSGQLLGASFESASLPATMVPDKISILIYSGQLWLHSNLSTSNICMLVNQQINSKLTQHSSASLFSEAPNRNNFGQT